MGAAINRRGPNNLGCPLMPTSFKSKFKLAPGELRCARSFRAATSRFTMLRIT
jgi:hypothetical protein